MPSYNQGKFIGRALDSIFAQNYPNLEVIVVDGLSKDNTVEVLKTYGERVRWISEKDKNQSDALNKGFKMASGEIIAWLNADDLYDTGAFFAMAKHFKEHPECMWLFGRCIIIDENDKEIRQWMTAYKNLFLPHYSYTSLLIQNFISQMAVFFRKKAANEVGELDVELRNAMDYDFWLRLGKRYKPDYIDQNFGKFRIHGGSKTVKENDNLFGNDYLCAKKYAEGRLWIIFLHKLFHLSVTAFYGLVAFLNSLKSGRGKENA